MNDEYNTLTSILLRRNGNFNCVTTSILSSKHEIKFLVENETYLRILDILEYFETRLVLFTKYIFLPLILIITN